MNRRLWALTLALLYLVLPLSAGAETLRVGVGGSPPFVLRDTTGPPQGIAADLWMALAHDLGVDTQVVPVTSYTQALQDVADHKLDVLVGDVTITAGRARMVDFTQPFFHSQMAIMIVAVPQTLLQRLSGLLNRNLLTTVLVSLLLLFLMGNLLWLTERKANSDHFPAQYGSGVGNGMWAALVTFTTVGYGDRYPVTRNGRLVTALWMVFSVISVSSLTAVLASAITLSGINSSIDGPDALAGRRTVVIRDTTSVAYAATLRTQPVPVGTLADGVQLVEDKKVDAMLFDAPVLEYYLRQHPDAPLHLVASNFGDQNFGFAVALNSPLRHRLNLALLKLSESGKLQSLVDKWLGDKADSPNR